GADRPTFEGREVVLGPLAGDRHVVVSGLREGERVVVHGAFRIDSALQIIAKPSMMSPEGGRSAPGHAGHAPPATGGAEPDASDSAATESAASRPASRPSALPTSGSAAGDNLAP